MRTQVHQADRQTGRQRDHVEVPHRGGGVLDVIAQRGRVPTMQVDFPANESSLDDNGRRQVQGLALTIARWVHEGLSSGEIATGRTGRAGVRILASGGSTSSEDGHLGRARAQVVSRELRSVLEGHSDSTEPWLRAVARAVLAREVPMTATSHGQGARLEGKITAGARAVLVAVGAGGVASFPSQPIRELLMRVCVVMAERSGRMVPVSPEAVEYARVQLGISVSVTAPGVPAGTEGPEGVPAVVTAIGAWLLEQRMREKAQPWLISGIDFLRARGELDVWQASRVDLLAEMMARQISALRTGRQALRVGPEPDGQGAPELRICVVGGHEPSEPATCAQERAWAVAAQLRRHPALALQLEAGARIAVMSRGRGSRLAGTTNEARRQVLVQVDDGRPALMERGSWDLLLRVRAQLQVKTRGEKHLQAIDPVVLTMKLNEFLAHRSVSGQGSKGSTSGIASRDCMTTTGPKTAEGLNGVQAAADYIAECLMIS
jgi:hypothetical protein